MIKSIINKRTELGYTIKQMSVKIQCNPEKYSNFERCNLKTIDMGFISKLSIILEMPEKELIKKVKKHMDIVDRTCLVCGKRLEGNKKAYCSAICSASLTKNEHLRLVKQREDKEKQLKLIKDSKKATKNPKYLKLHQVEAAARQKGMSYGEYTAHLFKGGK